MPKFLSTNGLRPQKISLSVPEIRVLRALAGGGTLTAATIGMRSGLTGSAPREVLAALAQRGMAAVERLDIDGIAEERWRVLPAGTIALAGVTDGQLPNPKARVTKGGGGPRALVPLFGSNRLLAPEVGKLLQGCAWVGIPFMGSLAELPYITAMTVLASDLHRHLVNLVLVAADPVLCAGLMERLDDLVFHEDTLAAAQDRCMQREEQGVDQADMPDPDWACDYFVCAWMARSGAAGTGGEFDAALSVRWNANGGDSAKRFFNAIPGLAGLRESFRKTTFICLDAFGFLAKVKDEAGHGVYCDPPFPSPGNAYKHRFPEASHWKLAQVLAGYAQARVVCRFHDHPLIRELYPESVGWAWHRFAGRRASNTNTPEVLLVRNGRVEGQAEEGKKVETVKAVPRAMFGGGADKK